MCTVTAISAGDHTADFVTAIFPFLWRMDWLAISTRPTPTRHVELTLKIPPTVPGSCGISPLAFEF